MPPVPSSPGEVLAAARGVAGRAGHDASGHAVSGSSTQPDAERLGNLRSLFEDAPIGIFHTSLDGRLLLANPAAARMFGYPSGAEMVAVISDVARQLFVEPERRSGYLAQALATAGFIEVENPYRRRDGSVFLAQLWLRAVRDGRGEPLHLEGFIADVTARRRAEQELRASEARYRLLFEMESDAIVLLEEANGQIVEVNRAATELYGYTRDEFVRLRNVDVSAEPEQTRQRTLERAERVPLRRHRRKDGSTFLCELSCRPLEWGGAPCQLVTIRDITARTRAEEERARLIEQLQRSQKMEAVGRLASGIAHDFNNLLTVVRSCGDLVRENLPADSDPRRDMEEILAVADRGTALVRQLLTFARQEVQPGGRAEAAGILRTLCGILPRLLGAGIAVEASIPDDLGVVLVTEVQLEQVLLNLAINARDAMPEGGRLFVQAERRRPRPGEPAGLGDREYVAIVVRDTGVGMTQEVQAHLFEPFFTTKPAGVGTGLGLATCRGIVEEAGGALAVQSAPGAGATFTVRLPVT